MNGIIVDVYKRQLIFRFRRRRKAHLDLLKPNLYQELEKLQLFFQAHGHDQRLVSIPQVHTAPNRRFLHIFLLGPVIAGNRRHKILCGVLFYISHLKTRLLLLFCPLLLQKGDKGGPAGFGFRFRQQKKPFASPNRDERLSKVSRGTTLISRLTACPHCRYGRYSGLYPPAVTVGLRLRLLDNSFSVLLQGQFKAFAQPLLTTQRLSAC